MYIHLHYVHMQTKKILQIFYPLKIILASKTLFISVLVCKYTRTSDLNDAYTKSEFARFVCFLTDTMFHPQELSPSP